MREFRREHLERHVPVKPPVAGEEHGAHATAPEFPLDRVTVAKQRAKWVKERCGWHGGNLRVCLAIVHAKGMMRPAHSRRSSRGGGSRGEEARRSIESTQDTACAFGQRCPTLGVRPSMGSRGDAWDNAMAESRFSTLECEWLAKHRITRTEAHLVLDRYIEGRYDLHREHSALGQRSPLAFEQLHAVPSVAACYPNHHGSREADQVHSAR